MNQGGPPPPWMQAGPYGGPPGPNQWGPPGNMGPPPFGGFPNMPPGDGMGGDGSMPPWMHSCSSYFRISLCNSTFLSDLLDKLVLSVKSKFSSSDI